MSNYLGANVPEKEKQAQKQTSVRENDRFKQLENELGVPLFEKNGRNTTLTRFGREFLVCAENTLATLDSGVEAARRSAAGEGLIRLGFVRPAGV